MSVWVTVLPLTRKFPCEGKYWAFQGKMQGIQIYKEMPRKFDFREGN